MAKSTRMKMLEDAEAARKRLEQEQREQAERDVAKEVEVEIEEASMRPDDVPDDVWQLIQDNGRLATERLNSILASHRFARLRPSDQAKFIKLAQDRAYGTPKTNNGAAQARLKGSSRDATASALAALTSKIALPEYKKAGKAPKDVEDATVLPPRKTH